MRISNQWVDYECVDAGDGEKVERYQNVLLRRPEPVATRPMNNTYAVDAFFDQSWHFQKELPKSWHVSYKDMKFIVFPTSFKHTGIFPEHAVNWDWMRSVIRQEEKTLRILNLFAYTGAATIACAMEPNTQEVVHIDALKSLNTWAQENVALNGLEDKTIRTITEDVLKFCAREKKRGRTYHGIVMDPPSFGRGPKGERWKIEGMLDTLIEAALDILDKDACFLSINTYTTHLGPETVRKKLVNHLTRKGFEPNVSADTIGLPITHKKKALMCGVTTRWCSNENLL